MWTQRTSDFNFKVGEYHLHLNGIDMQIEFELNGWISFTNGFLACTSVILSPSFVVLAQLRISLARLLKMSNTVT